MHFGRRRARSFPWILASGLLGACNGGDDDAGGDGSADTVGLEDGLPPTDPAMLGAWLERGDYLQWTAESAIHASAGPHFGGVRTFIDPVLEASLEEGEPMHPEGAATVKELYGDGDTIRGWAVAVKTQAASADGDGWYWYEAYDGSIVAQGQGLSLCASCHRPGVDYILTPFPLQ